MQHIRHIRIFLSSPGDVGTEREIAHQVIEELRSRPLLRDRLSIRVIAWDKASTGTVLRAGMKPQEAINMGLPRPSQCDISLIILWSRMGTSFTDSDGKQWESGTHWELHDALFNSTHSRTVIYRSRIEPRSLADLQAPDYGENKRQWDRLQQFLASDLFYKESQIQRSVTDYHSHDEFRAILATNLEELVKEILSEPEQTNDALKFGIGDLLRWGAGLSLFVPLAILVSDLGLKLVHVKEPQMGFIVWLLTMTLGIIPLIFLNNSRSRGFLWQRALRILVIQAALLIGAIFAKGLILDKVADQIISKSYVAVISAQRDGLESLAVQLSEVSAEKALNLAQTYDKMAINELAKSHPDYAQVKAYLSTVRVLDMNTAGRSKVIQSNSRYILGFAAEQLAATLARNDILSEAIDYYGEAIVLSNTNLRAYYALSSLLLVDFPEDAERQSQSASIARAGRSSIDEKYCSGRQILTDKTVFENSWYCFLFLTTEGGARLNTDVLTDRDPKSDPNVKPLIDRAIRLAEANEQFTNAGNYYTAEAYYYLAKITEPNSDTELLCQIILNHNRDKTRHRDWASYANQMLAGRTCTSGS